MVNLILYAFNFPLDPSHFAEIFRDREGWEERITKGQKENLGNDQNVLYLDYSEGFMNVAVC